MFKVILEIVASVFGGIAAWYISKKIASWINPIIREWDRMKDEKLKQDLQEQAKTHQQEIDEKAKKIDDFLSGGKS